MLNLKKVAITGGLSSGKSSVCQIFKELGAYVVSADEIVHQLLSSDTTVAHEVVLLLGSDVLLASDVLASDVLASDDRYPQERLDRQKIATKVFNNLNLLKSLEEILHPKVRNEIELQYQKACQQSPKGTFFLAEIPLLFESSVFEAYRAEFGTIITVVSSRENSLERFRKATGSDKVEFDKRMARQMPPEEKVKKADFVINNDQNFEELRKAVISLYTILLRP